MSVTSTYSPSIGIATGKRTGGLIAKMKMQKA
jgi:hypothetical protein